jgi:hypothetical protein
VDPRLLSRFAEAVLWLHVCVILFNVAGLVAIPLGAWRGWRFIRIFWWRALHLAILAVVAIQAVLEKACFLTVWQNELLECAGETPSSTPLIERWVIGLIFWPLPLWCFVVLYVAVCIYTIVLWRLVPPTRSRTIR